MRKLCVHRDGGELEPGGGVARHPRGPWMGVDLCITTCIHATCIHTCTHVPMFAQRQQLPKTSQLRDDDCKYIRIYMKIFTYIHVYT